MLDTIIDEANRKTDAIRDRIVEFFDKLEDDFGVSCAATTLEFEVGQRTFGLLNVHGSAERAFFLAWTATQTLGTTGTTTVERG